jgi:hypothetical protein
MLSAVVSKRRHAVLVLEAVLHKRGWVHVHDILRSHHQLRDPPALLVLLRYGNQPRSLAAFLPLECKYNGLKEAIQTYTIPFIDVTAF